MVKSLRGVAEVCVFLDTLGCSSAHHLKAIGLAHDVGFWEFMLLLVTTGWHVRVTAQTASYLVMSSSGDRSSVRSGSARSTADGSKNKTRPLLFLHEDATSEQEVWVN